MAGQTGRGTPQPGRTDFESMTHEQLAALLESASSAGASQLATKLAKASSTITKIGDDLMTYVKGLEWQGEGGDAFRDWGGQSAAATLRLGQYAEVASRWMATVAQAVAEAKAAMPATSETAQAKADLADARKAFATTQEPGARNDPDARKLAQTAQSDAAAAQQRMEAARAEAIQQLRKLAQTYEYSAQQVNGVEPPTFSPPAEHLEAPQWRRPDAYLSASSPPQTGSTASDPSYEPPIEGRASHARRASGAEALAGTEPVTSPREADQSVHSRPVAMNIDAATLAPQTPHASNTTAVPPAAGVFRPESSLPTLPVPPAPATSGRAGLQTPVPVSPPPGSSAARGQYLPGQGLGQGGTGGLGGTTRTPSAGIVGGRPVAPGPNAMKPGMPRGTVIGAESAHGRIGQSQTPMGRVGSPGVATGGSAVTGQSGLAGGRRLTSESGGAVGSRPLQPGRGGIRPFTPGGSGLVRTTASDEPHRGSTSGRAAIGTGITQPSTQRRDLQGEERGQRPDYVTEERETWVRSDSRPVPRVVD